MLKKLTDDVYCLGAQNYDRPILGLVSGNKHSLIIDAGDSSEHAREFQKEIRKLDIAPLKYLVLTHHHDDHIAGLIEWEQAISISSKTTKEKVQGIDVGFQNELIIDLGGVSCLIKEIPSSHTEDSTIVYVVERRVMFLGDALYTTRIDNKFHYSKEITLRMIDVLEMYNVDRYVFSHVPLCESDRLAMRDFLGKLKFVTKYAQSSASIDEVKMAFEGEYGRQPTENEIFVMTCLF